MPEPGWYWVKYSTGNGRRVCPAYVSFVDGERIVRTARNDGFRTYHGKLGEWFPVGEGRVHRSFRIWSVAIPQPMP